MARNNGLQQLFICWISFLPLIYCQPEQCSLPPDQLPECSCWIEHGMYTLGCSNQNFTDVPEFPDLDADQVSIELSYNAIAAIHANVFENLDFTILDLSHNVIRTVDPDAFKFTAKSHEHEQRIWSIDLSHNELEDLNADLSGSNLKHLDVSGNKIRDVTGLLSKLPGTLERLDLWGNPLTGAGLGKLVAFHNLKHLSISLPDLSPIESIIKEEGVLYGLVEPDEIAFPSKLHSLQITDTCERFPFPTNQFEHLKRLDLQRVCVEELDDSELLDFLTDQLQFLTMRHCGLHEIPDTVGSLPQLQSLDLSFNAITSVSESILNHLHHLENINLQHNAIATLPGNFFSAPTSLKMADLSHNALRFVPRIPGAEAAHAQMTGSGGGGGGSRELTVMLSNNPLTCCGNMWVVEAAAWEMKGNHGPLTTAEIFTNLSCELVSREAIFIRDFITLPHDEQDDC